MPTPLTEQQIAELDLLRERSPDLRFEVHEDYPQVATLSGLASSEAEETPDRTARSFIGIHRELFGIHDPDAELRDPAVSVDQSGWTHVTYAQYREGVPVWSGCLTAHIDPEQRLQSLSNSVRPGVPETLEPVVGPGRAIEAARGAAGHGPQDRVVREPRLFIYPDERPVLAWVFALEGTQVSYLDNREYPGAWLYFVDAATGEVIRRAAIAKEAAQTSTGLSIANPGRLTQVPRTVHSWHNDTNQRDELRDTVTGAADGVEIQTRFYSSGDLCWDDDPAPLGDNNWNRVTRTVGGTVVDLATSSAAADRVKYQPAEIDAHFHGAELYSFWHRAPFNRKSLDNAGCAIRLKPHRPGISAGWDGTHITLGDGDMSIFTYKGGQLDVLGHESTHAVLDHEVAPDGLTYSGQSGAAEESFCDVFGAFAEHNWLFEELVTVLSWTCLRNLADPGDPNAFEPGHDHYDDYIASSIKGESADPHTNCHILNTACYLMTHGGVHHRAGRTPGPEDIPVYPGMDWTAAEDIYYRALTEGFTGNPGTGSDTEKYFAVVRKQILLAAEQASGLGSCAYKTARLAFYAIGLQPASEHYGPDVAVTPWGYVTHEGATWQSPDFYVRDAAGNPAEPERDAHNRLFIRVRNIGDEPAANVQVRARFAPFSATYHHTHFLDIAVSAPFSLSSGQEQEVEFDWDLTNLDENNGGLWPAAGGQAGIRGYDHFCVRAEIICESDVNSCNNTAQTNFTNVPLHAGDTYKTSFLVFSPYEEECWGQLSVARHLPRSWKVALDGIGSRQRVRLRPRDPMVVGLQVTASPQPDLEPPLDGGIVGKFGPRHIPTRRVPLRELGEFAGEVRVERYYTTRQTFSGEMEGRLARTGQRIRGHVRVTIVDPVSGSVAGTFEGHLLGEAPARHEPVMASFEGRLQPWRDVSVSMEVPGTPTTGLTLRFSRG